MKKNAACIIMPLALSLVLCGCGSDRTDTIVTPSPMVSTTPYISPAVDDGVVDDTDGAIEEDGTATGDDGLREDTASPSPDASSPPKK